MPGSTAPIDISPAETRDLLAQDAAQEPLLLDCRTPEERRLALIEGSLLIPMDELNGRVDELKSFRGRPIVVYCHGGVRSRAVAQFLRQHGFLEARSLAGGIDRWSREIDPSVPRY